MPPVQNLFYSTTVEIIQDWSRFSSESGRKKVEAGLFVCSIHPTAAAPMCDQLHSFADIEREVIVLVPLPRRQFVIRPTMVVLSANTMMLFELCLATRSCVNKEYSKGLCYVGCLFRHQTSPV